jgi:hypothetical protein
MGCYSQLDVDENRGGGRHGHGTRDAVENITTTRLIDGEYTFGLNNYRTVERIDVSSTVELDLHGRTFRFYRDSLIPEGTTSKVATVTVKNGKAEVTKVYKEWSTSEVSKDIWGIKTGDWHTVNILTQSPNWWHGEQHGSRHLFFILDGCMNPDIARGLYNEFISTAIKQKHRKVLEVLGARTSCESIPGGLSGLGFSSAVSDEVKVRLTKSGQKRVYTIVM